MEAGAWRTGQRVARLWFGGEGIGRPAARFSASARGSRGERMGPSRGPWRATLSRGLETLRRSNNHLHSDLPRSGIPLLTPKPRRGGALPAGEPSGPRGHFRNDYLAHPSYRPTSSASNIPGSPRCRASFARRRPAAKRPIEAPELNARGLPGGRPRDARSRVSHQRAARDARARSSTRVAPYLRGQPHSGDAGRRWKGCGRA